MQQAGRQRTAGTAGIAGRAHLGRARHVVSAGCRLEGGVVQDVALAVQAQVVLADGGGAACQGREGAGEQRLGVSLPCVCGAGEWERRLALACSMLAQHASWRCRWPFQYGARKGRWTQGWPRSTQLGFLLLPNSWPCAALPATGRAHQPRMQVLHLKGVAMQGLPLPPLPTC